MLGHHIAGVGTPVLSEAGPACGRRAGITTGIGSRNTWHIRREVHRLGEHQDARLCCRCLEGSRTRASAENSLLLCLR